MRIRTAAALICAAVFTVAVGSSASRLHAETATLAASAAASASPAVNDLMARDLVGVAGKEVRMLTVEYAPGGSSPSHRHDAEVFVYVLQGSLRMQVRGLPAVTLKAGDTFYESPHDVHEVSANASDTEPAKFLVFMVKDKAAPVSSPPSQRPQS
jgi:quercetin dioxygenase-like cupin family protein